MLCARGAFPFAASKDQCAVHVRYASPEREILVIEGRTYALRLDIREARITAFEVGGVNVLDEGGTTLSVNGRVHGPGRMSVSSFGAQMCEVRLDNLKVEGLDADIGLALYCYGKRVFVNATAVAREALPELNMQHNGAYRGDRLWIPPDEEERFGEHIVSGGLRAGMYPIAPSTSRPFGTMNAQGHSHWTWEARKPETPGTELALAFALLAGNDPPDLVNLLDMERQPEAVKFKVDGGAFAGYQREKGFFQITADPATRREVAVQAFFEPDVKDWVAPSEVICNVLDAHGLLVGAVLTDGNGYPLPTPVQVSSHLDNRAQGKDETPDPTSSEVYFPITFGTEKSVERRLCWSLAGRELPQPVVQLASVSCPEGAASPLPSIDGAFLFTPLEPGYSSVLAGVRGGAKASLHQTKPYTIPLSSAVRYRSEGRWVDNLLQDTRIYLTGPNLVNFAVDYLTDDGKVKTTLEIFLVPEDDEARCFVKMVMDVVDSVQIDEDSAHTLKFFDWIAGPGRARRPKLAYTADSGKFAVLDVPGNDTWALEGAPLGPEWPFVAAYGDEEGRCLFVNRFQGVLGGKPAPSFGLSCLGGRDAPEAFLTAAGRIPQLVKGDHIEAHLFLMPYVEGGFGPAERQRALYGRGLPTVNVQLGRVAPGYPRRMKTDPLGFVEFTLSGGHTWVPLVIEGLPSHGGVMV